MIISNKKIINNCKIEINAEDLQFGHTLTLIETRTMRMRTCTSNYRELKNA